MKEQVTLSNAGFKDLMIDADIRKMTSTVISDEIHFSLEAEENNNSYFHLLNNQKTNTHYMVEGRREASDYLTYLIKIAQRNKINHTDTVFFTKNSKFPRTSFNRYSTKAKLVQKVDKATKFVINANTSIRQRSKEYIKVTNDDTGQVFYFYIEAYSLRNALQNLDYNTRNKKYASCNNANTGYNSMVTITKDIKQSFTNCIKDIILTENFSLDPSKIYSLISSENVKDKETLEFLLKGDIPISGIITDKAANEYIDQFKGELDDGMLKYLKETLDISTSDPEVPMQLLCNLKIKKFDPKLHALLLSLNANSFYNILGHRVYKTVDVVNFIETHKIRGYFESPLSLYTKLSKIGELLGGIENKKEKAELFSLTKETLLSNLCEIMNVPPGTLNVDYEGIKD